MNLEQVITTLTATFNESLNDGEQRKIVFWVDKDREFVEEIQQVALDKVKFHQLTEKNNPSGKRISE